MASENMLKQLNAQINAELYSSYLYLAMSAYFEEKNLSGCAQWMALQSQEEYTHAMKFYHYVNEINGRVILEAIEKPDFEWDSAKSVFEATLTHEKHVTSLINKLVDLALEERDHATNNFLSFFVGEQVEEESVASGILEKFKMIGDSLQGLYLLDKELGGRQATPAATE
nr:ferritin [uncultured Sphaerochaeta sp.]